MNLRSFAFLGALFVISCATFRGHNIDDQEIMSLTLREICNNREPGVFVLSSATAGVNPAFVPEDLDQATRQSLVQRNRNGVGLPAADACREKFIVLSAKEIDDYFEAPAKGGLQERWSAFYERYPDVNGIMTLSLPGYSAQGDAALLQVSGTCGPLCGNGSFWIFRKEFGRWRVEKATQGWTN